MPITPWQALRAKLEMHLILTEIPMFICGVCALIAFRPSIPDGIFMIILPLLYSLLFACIGLFADLRKPNLKWTNEVVPVKQNLSVLFVIFGGWIYTVAVIGLYFAFFSTISTWVYLCAVSVITAAASALLWYWIKTRGAKIFASL